MTPKKRRRTQGGKISLSVLESSHWADKIQQWKNDPDLARLIMAHCIPVSLAEARQWLEKNGSDKNQVLFGVFTVPSKRFVGIARLMFIDWISRTAEVGLYIGDGSERGRGYGKQIVELLIRYAFEDLALRKLTLKVLESNTAAVSCYLKCGFVKEGLLRKQFWSGQKYENVTCMGLLR